MITSTQLKSIMGSGADKIAPLLDKICPMYGIYNTDILEEFLSNVLHESNCFKVLVESLNYQAVALTLKFGRHRISIDDCYRYGRTMKQSANQKAIANILYGGEWGKTNLGNTQPNDGWDFRGSGPMQITGRYLGTKFMNYYNNRFMIGYSLVRVFELLRTDIAFGIHAACWLFAIEKKLIDEAINDDMLAIRKGINGGTFGMAEVERYYKLFKKYV